MKRFIKWLINWFADWVGEMHWEEKVGFSVGGLLGIALVIIAFISMLHIDSAHWILALVLAIMLGIIVFIFGGIILTLVIALLEVLAKWICKIIKPIKAKFQK